jgi:hypothetical protein
MKTTREIEGGVRRGRGGARRGAHRLLAGAALIFLVLLVNGCEGCKTLRWKSRLGMAQLCDDDMDCKQTCPQGNVCLHYAGGLREPPDGLCICRDAYSPPCATARDCPSRGPGVTCDMGPGKVWTCMHYPRSSVGSCECTANCATDLDCNSFVGCPGGSVCKLYPGGDGGACFCSTVFDCTMDRDCELIPDCPQAPQCIHIPYVHKGACRCPSAILDGGAR